jgi:hypothetical protein
VRIWYQRHDGWLQWCRFEQCVRGLTIILISSLSCLTRSNSRSRVIVCINSENSFLMSLCNSKPLHVRKLRLSCISQSYSSNKLLPHWRISDWLFYFSPSQYWVQSCCTDRQQGTVLWDLTLSRQLVLRWYIQNSLYGGISQKAIIPQLTSI